MNNVIQLRPRCGHKLVTGEACNCLPGHDGEHGIVETVPGIEGETLRLRVPQTADGTRYLLFEPCVMCESPVTVIVIRPKAGEAPEMFTLGGSGWMGVVHDAGKSFRVVACSDRCCEALL